MSITHFVYLLFSFQRPRQLRFRFLFPLRTEGPFFYFTVSEPSRKISKNFSAGFQSRSRKLLLRFRRRGGRSQHREAAQAHGEQEPSEHSVSRHQSRPESLKRSMVCQHRTRSIITRKSLEKASETPPDESRNGVASIDWTESRTEARSVAHRWAH